MEREGDRYEVQSMEGAFPLLSGNKRSKLAERHREVDDTKGPKNLGGAGVNVLGG